jgi:RNA polymerase sigma-70 factor (ECF subfamily)
MQDNDKALLATFNDPTTREAGFRMLVNEYSKPLYRQIYRYTGTHEDTDDVLQLVLIKAWRYLDTFRGDSGLYTWLFRIAYNECHTFLKQRQRKQLHSLPNNYDAPDTNNGGPDAEQIQQKLLAAIDTLPDKQKEVFLLRYYEEMPYEEMSRLLGTSEGALKASYHHAVKKIEAYLTERA